MADGGRAKTEGAGRMQLEAMTWKQAERYFNDEVLAILPVGSVEQHGPIAPLGTDLLIPQEIARRLGDLPEVLVLPAMPFGVCANHMKFPGTVDIGYQALVAVMNNVSRSLMSHGIRRFLFLNGHSGNTPALEEISRSIYDQGGIAALIDWWLLAAELNPAWTGGHGARHEASIMLAINADWVYPEEYFTGEVSHVSQELPSADLVHVRYQNGCVRVARSVRDVVANGSWSNRDDSLEVSPVLGQEMLDGITRYIADFIQVFKKVVLVSK